MSRIPYPKHPELVALAKLFEQKFGGSSGFRYGCNFKELYYGKGYTHLRFSVTDVRTGKSKLETMELDLPLAEYKACWLRLMIELGYKPREANASSPTEGSEGQV